MEGIAITAKKKLQEKLYAQIEALTTGYELEGRDIAHLLSQLSIKSVPGGS